jgi:hypothetical protein
MKAKCTTATLALPLETDIPFWIDEISYKKTYGKGILAERVIANTNGITILAYRDSAPMIIEIVKKEMVFVGKYSKSLLIGVEIGQTSEGGMMSFFEEGVAYMNQEQVQVSNFYNGSPRFSLVAVHQVGSWETMKP